MTESTHRNGNIKGGSTPHTLEHRDRETTALALRSKGLTLQQIADELGYADRSGPAKAIRNVLARADAESAEELRLVHGERLAAGYAVVASVLTAGYPPLEIPDGTDATEAEAMIGAYVDRLERLAELKLKAVDRLVRLMERESRLFGLDMPVRAEVSGPGGVPFVVEIPAALRVPGADTTR